MCCLSCTACQENERFSDWLFAISEIARRLGLDITYLTPEQIVQAIWDVA